MYYKHPLNPNLTLSTHDYFNGYKVYTDKGPNIVEYLNESYRAIGNALQEHPRTLAVRVDLRFPGFGDPIDELDRDIPLHTGSFQPQAISKFFESLKAQLKAEYKRKTKAGKRVHRCTMRFIWVKEYSDGNSHYHVLLLLNNDTHRSLGDYEGAKGDLADKIRTAWVRALGLDRLDYGWLVHFPSNPVYRVDRNATQNQYQEAFGKLFYRVSYFSKADTKLFGGGFRSFGCSQL